MKYIAMIVVLLLGACARTVDAPSLLPRPAETADFDSPASPPVPTTAPSPAQAALIAKLVDQAQRGNAAFDKALPSATTNAPAHSEAWVAAQNARSAVEVARGPTLDALSGLDAAIGDAIDRGEDTGALHAARVEVQAIYDRQAARLDALIR